MVAATAREKRKGGIRAGAKPAARYGLQGALLVAPYYVALLNWPHLALSLFYGHSSSYLGLGSVVRIFATAYFASYAFMAASAFLNGIEKSQLVLRSDLAGAGALVLAVPLAARYGVRGACVGYLVVNLVRRFRAASFAIGQVHDEDRRRSGLMRGALQGHTEG